MNGIASHELERTCINQICTKWTILKIMKVFSLVVMGPKVMVKQRMGKMDIKEPNDYIKAYILIFLVPQVSHILFTLQGVQAHNYTCVCYSHFQLE